MQVKVQLILITRLHTVACTAMSKIKMAITIRKLQPHCATNYSQIKSAAHDAFLTAAWPFLPLDLAFRAQPPPGGSPPWRGWWPSQARGSSRSPGGPAGLECVWPGEPGRDGASVSGRPPPGGPAGPSAPTVSVAPSQHAGLAPWVLDAPLGTGCSFTKAPGSPAGEDRGTRDALTTLPG